MSRRSLVPPADTVAALDALVEATARTPRSVSGHTQNNWHRTVELLDELLVRLGLAGGVTELTKRLSAEQGHPELPPVLLVAFMVDRMRTARPKSAQGYVSDLISALEDQGWDVSRAREAARAGVFRTIRANAEAASGDDLVAAVSRARPLLPADVEALLDVLDGIAENPGATHPLWIAWWRAMLLVGWFCGLRSGELITARWSWVEWVRVDGRTALAVTVPPSKFATEEHRFVIESTGDRLCPIAALQAWQVAAETAGVPTGPDDALFVRVARRDAAIPNTARGPGKVARTGRVVTDFPELAADLDLEATVAAYPRAPVVDAEGRPRLDALSAGARCTVCWRCARCGWRTSTAIVQRVGCASCMPLRDIAGSGHGASGSQFYDPMGHFLDDATWNPDATPEARRAMAITSARRAIASDWHRLCRDAGFTARTQLEFTSLYGLRRGPITTMHRAGTPIGDIASFARHTNPATTSLYVGTADVPPADVAGTVVPPSGATDDLVVLAAAMEAPTASPRPRTCELLWEGTACGRRSVGRATVDGEIVLVCSAHDQRFRNGDRGDVLYRPIGMPRRPTTCELTWEGTACGRSAATTIQLDGVELRICAAHDYRHRQGHRGPDLCRPIGWKSEPDHCHLEGPDGPCGRPFVAHVHDKGQPLPLCSMHYRRWADGDRGDRLVRPAKRRLRSETCEVSFAGTACGRSSESTIVVDGVETAACTQHAARAREGLTGADLCRPIGRPKLAPACEVLWEGRACGRPTESWIIYGDDFTCLAHARRAKRGLTGEALHSPIPERAAAARRATAT